MMKETADSVFKPALGPVIDPACADQLQVSSRMFEYKGSEYVQITTTCQRCAGCVLAFASELGNDRHLRQIASEFCAPGEFQEL